MAKTLNNIIETHWYQGLSYAKIFKALKGSVSRSNFIQGSKKAKRYW